VKGAQNSIGPGTCWQPTGPSDRPGRSPRILTVGPGTDPRRSGREAFATLVAPTLEHSPAGSGAHAGPEPMSLLALPLVGLVSPLHVSSLVCSSAAHSLSRGHAVKTIHHEPPPDYPRTGIRPGRPVEKLLRRERSIQVRCFPVNQSPYQPARGHAGGMRHTAR